jgi:hypothetical protein
LSVCDLVRRGVCEPLRKPDQSPGLEMTFSGTPQEG